MVGQLEALGPALPARAARLHLGSRWIMVPAQTLARGCSRCLRETCKVWTDIGRVNEVRRGRPSPRFDRPLVLLPQKRGMCSTHSADTTDRDVYCHCVNHFLPSYRSLRSAQVSLRCLSSSLHGGYCRRRFMVGSVPTITTSDGSALLQAAGFQLLFEQLQAVRFGARGTM